MPLTLVPCSPHLPALPKITNPRFPLHSSPLPSPHPTLWKSCRHARGLKPSSTSPGEVAARAARSSSGVNTTCGVVVVAVGRGGEGFEVVGVRRAPGGWWQRKRNPSTQHLDACMRCPTPRPPLLVPTHPKTRSPAGSGRGPCRCRARTSGPAGRAAAARPCPSSPAPRQRAPAHGVAVGAREGCRLVGCVGMTAWACVHAAQLTCRYLCVNPCQPPTLADTHSR